MIVTISSAKDSRVGLSHSGNSNSSNLNSVIWPAFTRGGHSALRKRVDTVSSESKDSRESGRGGWSPKVAVLLSAGFAAHECYWAQAFCGSI